MKGFVIASWRPLSQYRLHRAAFSLRLGMASRGETPRCSVPVLYYFLLLSHAAIALSGPLVWPIPASLSFTESDSVRVYLLPDQFSIESTTSSPILLAAFERYTKRGLFFPFPQQTSTALPSQSTLKSLLVSVASDDENLQLGVDESYQLEVTAEGSTPSAYLAAPSVWGALRGLETFSQLIDWNPAEGTYSIGWLPVTIDDRPRFPWRGLLLDTARHYISIPTLRRTIDVLSWNKMNTLHWHITDAQSFPLVSRAFPLLSERGSYAPEAVYTLKDVAELVEYARYRGVRIVPEFDMPSHVASWGRAYPALTVPCADVSQDMIPFDPTNEDLYRLLDAFFEEVLPLFPDEMLHIGGDEVKLQCWYSNPAIASWMEANNFTGTPTMMATKLWTYFEHRLGQLLARHNRQWVVWQEIFFHDVQLDQEAVVEVWLDPNQLPQVVNAGHRALLAAGFYLDRQVPNSHAWPHYQWVETWTDFWSNDPYYWVQNVTAQSLIIGGEACMWSEQVDSVNLDSRVWPRASGAAERLWSPPEPRRVDSTDARQRLAAFRCRMAQRGIGAGPVTPDYCPVANITYGQIWNCRSDSIVTTVTSSSTATISSTSTSSSTVTSTATTTTGSSAEQSGRPDFIIAVLLSSLLSFFIGGVVGIVVHKVTMAPSAVVYTEMTSSPLQTVDEH